MPENFEDNELSFLKSVFFNRLFSANEFRVEVSPGVDFKFYWLYPVHTLSSQLTLSVVFCPCGSSMASPVLK